MFVMFIPIGCFFSFVQLVSFLVHHFVLNCRGLWSLDLCSCLLPQVQDLMDSKYDRYMYKSAYIIKISTYQLFLTNVLKILKFIIAQYLWGFLCH